MVKQINISNNKIYQLDLLKEVVLNCSTKGAMTSSFRRASCSLSSIRKKEEKLKCLSKLLELLIKFITKTFLK